jgi:hypothetical protein
MATQPHSIHAPGSRAGLLPPSPVVRKYVNVFSAGHIDAILWLHEQYRYGEESDGGSRYGAGFRRKPAINRKWRRLLVTRV